MNPLSTTQLPFDNKTLDYNVNDHPLPQIILDTLRKFYPEITTLDTIHEVVPANKIQQLMSDASQALLKTDFYDHFDKIVDSIIVPQLGTDILIQKFGNLRILVPDQDKIGAVLLFHQGRWVGNGLGLRTVWMPFTDCYESNSMQILDLDVSRELTRSSVAENWSYEKLQDACVDQCWPVTLHPGQAHLFFQEHLHGNIPNRTNKTRVSIDIRLLVKDGQPHRKWPGAYFRKLFDRDYTKIVNINPGENVLAYNEYEGIKTKHIDLHFQTLVTKSYCQKRGIPFPYQHGDNEGTNYAHLNFLVSSGNIRHLLMFSIFSLPDDPSHRRHIMQTALANGVRLHFCNEELVLETQEDLDKIEYLRTFTNDWSSPVDQLKEELNL
jgi:sporadic carbohydrate cluster 2OG-Fe(II) oxygenase/sporadic carbohydrate cluster protein (TIGR04323 family)